MIHGDFVVGTVSVSGSDRDRDERGRDIPPPVTGRLTGDPSASPDYVWLEAQDGKRQFLIWPGGFRVSFVVPLEVLDRNGNVIAKGGDVVTLQINASEHSGTTSDPYRVIGLLGRHCYQPGGS